LQGGAPIQLKITINLNTFLCFYVNFEFFPNFLHPRIAATCYLNLKNIPQGYFSLFI